MTQVDEVEGKKEGPKFYMTHHGIVKETNSTTKLRVLFNGTEKISNGGSLNDIMMAGPKDQYDLFHIVHRFRLHKIFVTADIAKMYRQVWVNVEDKSLQTSMEEDT